MRLRAAALSVALLVAAPPGAHAFDPAKTPVRPVAAERRGGWLPGSILLDSSSYSGHCDSSTCLRYVPISYDLEVAGSTLYVATGRGVATFALSDPLRPQVATSSYFPVDLPLWFMSDKDWYVKNLSALPGGLVTLAAEEQGVVVWSALGGVHLQHTGGFAADVYAAQIAGKQWAWVAADDGLTLFDLDVAAALSRCEDTRDAPTCGARVGLVAGGRPGSWIAGAGSRLALSTGAWVQAWDVTDPRAPVRLIDERITNRGVAVWQAAGGAYRLALLIPGSGSATVRVYSLGASLSLLGSLTVPTWSVPTRLTASQAAGRDWLSVGGQDPTAASCPVQEEFLFDATDPAAMAEVTPKVHPGGYWGWYYPGCPTGANHVIGMASIVAPGGYVYRAAFGAADVHRMATIYSSGFEGGRW